MRLRSRGLLVGGVDEFLYVSRERIESALLRPMLSGGNVLILGPIGAGKTTTLRKLETDLRDRDRNVVFVNAALADSPIWLLRLIGRQLDLRVDASLPILDAINLLRDAPPTSVLVDGPLPPEAARVLFGQFRDELWALEHQWAVTSTPRAATPLRVPPADAFWDSVVNLPELDDEEIWALARRGLDDTEISELGQGWWPSSTAAWPRTVVRVIRERLQGNISLQAGSQLDELRERRDELERVPAMVLAELEGIGHPVAAGDPDLLRAVGYSRAYVARALAELEKQGLVQSEMEQVDGKQGRPQKLYEPTLREPVWE